MADLFQNKYRIQTARLQSHDYGEPGRYFITINTKKGKHYFGEISPVQPPCLAALPPCLAAPNGCMAAPPNPQHVDQSRKGNSFLKQMILTEIGKIAEAEWHRTPELRPEMNIQLGEFIVMPNHIHGIIIIGNRRDAMHSGTDAMHRVSAAAAANRSAKFGPQSNNIASIIRGYKSAVTTYARKNNIEFNWHTRFHDHIIRTEMEYRLISNYIRNNPSKWQS